MDFELNEEQQMIIDTVRKIATNEIEPRAAELDETAGFPDHALKMFSENGILTPLLPEKYGGVETSFVTFAMIIEEIAKVCAASALLLIAQADGMLPILHGTNDALRDKYLNRLAGDSRALTAIAATEPAAGSDLLSMKTRAVRKGDRYIINGQKCFITNGSVADFFVAYAYTDAKKGAGGISAFVIEKDTIGFTPVRKEEKLGLRASDTAELLFEDCRIPKKNINLFLFKCFY